MAAASKGTLYCRVEREGGGHSLHFYCSFTASSALEAKRGLFLRRGKAGPANSFFSFLFRSLSAIFLARFAPSPPSLRRRGRKPHHKNTHKNFNAAMKNIQTDNLEVNATTSDSY